jgi:2-keto-4-pentenoate hydratase/2-oxohepta-3-ene-1,7-dioic acid hydratase in catechol pathway
MIFPVAQIVSYLSQYMTLEPGDLILTGCPGYISDPMYNFPGFITLGMVTEKRIKFWSDLWKSLLIRVLGESKNGS